MSSIILSAVASILMLSTPPTVFEQVVQLPVVYQGKLTIREDVTIPAVVHYDSGEKVMYIVALQWKSWGYQPIYVYKVPLDTLEPEEIWHDISVDV